MASSNEGMRDRLLSRLPQPENLEDYRREVGALLEKNQKGLRREKWGSGVLWIFLALLATVLLTVAGRLLTTPNAGNAGYLAALACFLLISGATELLKHFINRTRVELLKEVKQVQLQILEVHEAVRKAAH